MAKTASKSATKEPKKTSGRTTRTKTAPAIQIEKASEDVLAKLKALGIEQELQHDIEWCLGSYRSDQNPVGLYTMMERSLEVFRQQKTKKTKGVTAKLVTDLEKVLQTREV